METKENLSKGITLVALVITIVILLILAGITINGLTGEKGLITKANESKIVTIIGTLKEEITLEKLEDFGKDEEITVEQLLAKGKIKRTVQQGEDGKYYMYYAIKEDAYEGMQGLGKGTISTLKDVFLIDDEFNIRYIDKKGKEHGDIIENKILEDETDIRFASKAFSEYISKISGVKEEEQKFKWMKNQTSLSISDANVTTVEDLVFFPNLQSLKITGDTNLEDLEGVENCTKLTSIVFYNVNVNSIKGIEKCVDLKYFWIQEWKGTIYDLKGIDKCTTLEDIWIQRPYKDISNFIKDIKNLSNLKRLRIYNNSVLDKDIANLNENLTMLELRDAQLSNLEYISNLSNLTTLSLSNNQISNISPISNLVKLTNLKLDSNQISDISAISNLTELTTLELQNNQIANILPLSANTKLTTLNLKDNIEFEGNRKNYTGEDLIKLNKIGEILDKDGGKINVDVDKLGLFTNYKKLDLSNQNLENIYCLEGLTELTELNLSNNSLLKIDDAKSKSILNSMTKLKSIYFSYNKMDDISALNTITSLNYIGLWDAAVDLSDIEDIISNVTLLIGRDSILPTIINCNSTKITKINITTYNEFTSSTDLSKFTNLTELSIPKIKYDSYSFIEDMTKLITLNLSDGNLHDNMFNFSKLTSLTTLNLSGNYLSTQDIANLSVLKNNKNLTIDLSNNSIIDASSLLELDTSCKIYLKKNVNLSQESKDALKARFGSNVSF